MRWYMSVTWNCKRCCCKTWTAVTSALSSALFRLRISSILKKMRSSKADTSSEWMALCQRKGIRVGLAGDTEETQGLSLGRVGPAPHTQHLLGPFAAIAQNSSLWSFSIVDSLANRQHSCRGSEELAIRKTARFQATPSYFAELRATSQNSELLRATPSYSELLRVGGAQELRATQSNSELLSAIRIGSTKLPGNRKKLGTPNF